MTFVIGADIGATWIRVALANGKGDILKKKREEINSASSLGISRQIERLGSEIIEELGYEEADLAGIGIASAGPMDREEGRLTDPSNIPLEDVPLAGPLGERFNVEVDIINDGISAALAESKFGAGVSLDNLVYITISTGIGGGVVVDGNLLVGKNGNAAEVGHFTIDEKEKLKCGCGRRGHWEAYCSGSNIPDFVRMKLEELDLENKDTQLNYSFRKKGPKEFHPKELFELAREGDEVAIEIVEEIGRLNAIGFATVTDAYDPELITVGGAVALNNPNLILEPIRQEISNHTQNETPEIQLTPLEEENVLLGAIARGLSLEENEDLA